MSKRLGLKKNSGCLKKDLFCFLHNWLERNFSGFLLRTLVVGRRQHSESIEVALEWSKEV